MQYFSIKDIENLTGIKAHTLRIWEKRYNLVISKRKESNHRFFDNEDLKTILRITYLYETEFKISEIAKLSKEAVNTFAHIDHSNSKTTESYILQLLNAILDYDSVNFESILEKGINQYGFEKAISEIAYGLLRRIGLLWLTDHMIPAQEHFATNLIRSIIIRAIEELPNTPIETSENTILFTPIEEFHEIPLLFIHWLFKKNGIRSSYLGTNISLEDLTYCINKRNFTHLYFHIITNLTGKSLNEYVENILSNFPEQKLIVSGPITKEIRIISPQLTVLKTFEEIIKFSSDFKLQELHN